MTLRYKLRQTERQKERKKQTHIIQIFSQNIVTFRHTNAVSKRKKERKEKKEKHRGKNVKTKNKMLQID